MPKLLVLVLMILVYGSGQALDGLFRYAIKMEYYIWESQGLSELHFVVGVFNLVLYAAAAHAIFTRRSFSLHLCAATAVWSCAYSAILTRFAIKNLDGVRELYMLGREVRGLSIRPEAAELIFTPAGMWASWSVSLVLGVVVVGSVFISRAWYQPDE